jgi:hypothetical protein
VAPATAAVLGSALRQRWTHRRSRRVGHTLGNAPRRRAAVRRRLGRAASRSAPLKRPGRRAAHVATRTGGLVLGHGRTSLMRVTGLWHAAPYAWGMAAALEPRRATGPTHRRGVDGSLRDGRGRMMVPGVGTLGPPVWAHAERDGGSYRDPGALPRRDPELGARAAADAGGVRLGAAHDQRVGCPGAGWRLAGAARVRRLRPGGARLGRAGIVVGLARAAHVRACMVATAAFSTRPWDPELPYSRVEDLLSVTATAISALGVACLRGCAGAQARWRRLVASRFAMVAVGDVAGLAQRGMFAIAFAWYLTRTLGPPLEPAGAGSRPLATGGGSG